MTAVTHDIVAKLWNLCNVLEDDGVIYHQYVTDLTYLLFLKMAQQTGSEDRLPEGYRWPDLEAQPAPNRLELYKIMLIHLGTHGSRRTSSRDRFKQAAKEVRKMIREDKPFSAVVRACVISTGDLRVQGLLPSS